MLSYGHLKVSIPCPKISAHGTLGAASVMKAEVKPPSLFSVQSRLIPAVSPALERQARAGKGFPAAA